VLHAQVRDQALETLSLSSLSLRLQAAARSLLTKPCRMRANWQTIKFNCDGPQMMHGNDGWSLKRSVWL